MRDLVAAAGPSYEFVFLLAPYPNNRRALWILDPPGGKSSPTTDPNWDRQSLDSIDAVVATQGPFYGILGYSQGTAILIAYLAQTPASTFQVGLAFCAYVPTTHHGIVERINSATTAQLSLPMFIYMSTRDCIIDNCKTNAYAAEFNGNVTRSTASDGNHVVPSSGDQGFQSILTFLNAKHYDGSYVPKPPNSSELQTSGCDGFFICMLKQYWYVLVISICCCCCCCGCCCLLCHRYVCVGCLDFCPGMGPADSVEVTATEAPLVPMVGVGGQEESAQSAEGTQVLVGKVE